MIAVQPSAFTFPDTAVGGTSSAQTFIVADGPAGPRAHCGRGGVRVALAGEDAGDFRIVSQDCPARPRARAPECAVVVAFAPTTSGAKRALLRVSAEGGRTGGAALSASGVGTLSVLVGQPGGSGYADGVGRAVRFSSAAAVAADGAGNVYVADWGSYVIRKVAVATGLVTTFAGAPGIQGSADGAAGDARFTGLAAIVSDGAGNLYVADANYTIRRVVIATGAVTTIAGSPNASGRADGIGAEARFGLMRGLAYDSTGSLYVSEVSTIRRVDIASGAVITIAGSFSETGDADGTGPDARFYFPQQLVTDGGGHLYVADTYNGTVRKIVLATGVVTTFAGSPPAAPFTSPTGLTSDGAGNLYVADAGTIRKVVLATGEVSTLAGMTGVYDTVDGVGVDARFAGHEHLSGDGAGNLYIAAGTTVRRLVAATGAVNTLAGAAAPPVGISDGAGSDARFGWSGPGAMTSDGAGIVYVTDHHNHTIRRVAMATGIVTTLVGAPGVQGADDGPAAVARFSYPTGIALDGAGSLFVADTLNYRIRQLTFDPGEVSWLAGVASRIAIDGVGLEAGFRQPAQLTADASGNLYVTDGSSIRKIVVATRAVTTIAGQLNGAGSSDGPGADARFSSPRGMAVDSGHLYIADWANHTIRRLDLATFEVTTLAGSPGVAGRHDGVGAEALFNHPHDVTSDGMGHLYVADSDNHAVRRVTLATGAVTTFVGSTDNQAGVLFGPLPARLNQPTSILSVSPGTLLITDERAMLVARF